MSKITPTSRRRAVFIGINYIQSSSNRLAGCANDVKKMVSYMSGKKFDSVVLSDDIASEPEKTIKWPTRKNILNAIDWAIKDMIAGDQAFIHYSGHGGLTVDLSGDEVSGKDSCIYPISETGKIEYITDDELRVLVVERIPTGAKCTVVFDCCHSGTCFDMRYGYKSISDTSIILSENSKYPKEKGLVVFISGCTDVQTAADTVDKNNIPTGALTNAILEVLKSENKIKRFLWAVLKELSAKGYTQVPQLSSSIPLQLSDPFI
jgi:uncharacterized caspase-like protein